MIFSRPSSSFTNMGIFRFISLRIGMTSVCPYQLMNRSCAPLNTASECWVYGIAPDSSIWSAPSEIPQPHRGKHRIRTDLEMIRGHELLWNATGGKRGTIVILIDAPRLLNLGVFRHCSRPYIMSNMGAAHTPSALRWAKQRVRRV